MALDNLVVFHKQIDLIQDCIKRMANNSFLIKGWAIGILTIAMILLKEISIIGILICFIPLISFWYLDSFFLMTEKHYRFMYEKLIKTNPEVEINLDFYDLNPQKYREKIEQIDVMLSATLIGFYGSLCATVFIIFMVKKFVCF